MGADYRVVLNRNVAYGATSANVLTLNAALMVAVDYWAKAELGDKVQIFYPADSRDFADYQWIKGETDGPDRWEGR